MEELLIDQLKQPDASSPSIASLSFINKDPINDSSFLSRFFFYWAYRIISLSKRTVLKLEHLGNLSPSSRSKAFFDNIYTIWDNKKYKTFKRTPLLWTSIRTNLCSIIIVFILTLFNSCLSVLSIHFFRKFIQLFSDSAPLQQSHMVIAGIYLGIRFTDFMLQRKNTELLNYIGNKSSVELNCLIYDKLLKLSPCCEVKSGEIYNYLQNDSHKLQNMMSSCPNLLTVPFLIIMYNYLLFQYMGIAFVFGFAVMILFLFVNYHFRKKFSLYLKLHLKQSDQRMRIVTETFNNLKVIKLYGWDDVFMPRIQKTRDDELQALEKRYHITQISQTLLWLAPIAMSVAAIGAYQYFNDSFKIEDMFTCLGIFTSIQNPMRMLPVTFDNIVETLNSLGRIEKFLHQPEINKAFVIKNDPATLNDGIVIKIENGNYSWGSNRDTTFKQNPKQNEQGNRTQSVVQKQKTKMQTTSSSQISLSSTQEIAKDNLVELINMELNPNVKKSNKAILFEPDVIDDKSTVASSVKNEMILKNINFEVKKGEFVCIIGDVGSGKSSLLQAILNNMTVSTPRHTKLIVNGSISYVSQESWIQNTTVQNNILFFHKYDNDKYNKILNLCELKPDLDILVGGDLTEIGEKGVNLSGGQKARISIARAMYTDKDIFIFDDPISALDAHVGKNIMMNCIVNYLKNKTRILVTHALQYVSHADRIVYLHEGEIKWSGTYKELLVQPFYAEFINKINSYQDKKEANNNANSKQVQKDNTSTSSTTASSSKAQGNKVNTTNQIKRITKDETKEVGKIDKKVFFAYFKYIGGVCLISLLLLSLLTWQVLKVGSDMFLGYWGDNQTKETNLKHFIIYASLALGSTIFNYTRTYLITTGSLKCSVRLHKEMIQNLIAAPINLFHDTIPKGQIFNRLSKDLPTVDTYTMFWLMTLTSFGSSFMGAVVICSLYQPYCLFILPFFVTLCWYLSRFYMNCSRELTRMEGVLNSPILNMINETIPGATTIRAYNFEDIYTSNFQSRVDNHFKVRFYLIGTYQWYLLILNLLSFLFLLFLVVFTLIYKPYFTSKEIGILLTYSIVLQEDLIQFLSAYSNFENTMTKMERCLQYTKLISEKAQETKKDKEYSAWPSKGKIEFVDYSVKYRPETEIVLKNINFTLNPGEHLGIVGRTGSGKSTISLCLFRILEATTGKILIDDVDISTLGLKKLRNGITIIPQDATLMTGTLKYNIDPLGKYTDSEIIEVMRKIGFYYILKNHERGLEQNIVENGGNLSIGEKQLICITRAILRKSKIVIMDEATASIDFKTEEIIQNAINELLKESTIITIAHRIKTVVNSDKILVLDNGNIVEYDTPKNLLRNQKSYFYNYYTKSVV